MISSRLAPIDEEQFGLEAAAHLMRRALIGARAEEVRNAYNDGLQATVSQLLTSHKPNYQPIEHLIGGPVNSEVSPNDSPRSIAYFAEKNGRYTDFRQWWSRVMIEAPTSMQERLVLLWHMHYATSCNGAHYAEHAFDQNEALRDNVFGNLQDLAQEITLGFAMQAYLDGVASFWTPYRYSINENHARELLELHLLGHTGRNGQQPYSQADVIAVSRAMSGNHIVESWTDNSDDGTRSLWRERACRWREDRWYPYSNAIFGSVDTFTPRDVVPLLFKNCRDNVAWWLARRLYTEFCASESECDSTDVDDVARLILECEWNMTEIMRVLLQSRMFFDPRNRMRLVRPPIHLVLGTLRSFRATDVVDFTSDTPRDSCDLMVRLTRLGQLPYNPPNVSGWRRDKDWLTATDAVARIDMCRRFGAGMLTYMDIKDAYPVLTYNPLEIAKEYGDADNLVEVCRNVSIVLLGTSTKHVVDSLAMVAQGGMRSELWSPLRGDVNSIIGLRRLFTHALSAPRYQLY